MMGRMPNPHQCDERCACPEHGTPLIYSPATDDHACQDVECRYGHGGAADVRSRVRSRAGCPVTIP